MAKRRGNRSNTGGGLAPISETKEAFSKLAIDDEEEDDNDGTSAKRAAPERMDSAASSAASSSNDPSPIYLVNENTGASWELTWPIWHLLGHGERKEIANRYGYKSIGEFEEYMTLSKATSASAGGIGGIDTAATTAVRVASSPSAEAYDSSVLYDAEADPRNWGLPTVAERSADDPRHNVKRDASEDDYGEEEDKKPHARSGIGSDNDGDDDDSSTTSEDSAVLEPDSGSGVGKSNLKTTGLEEEGDVKGEKSEETEEELLKRGGPFLIFPEELSHRILTYLDVDAYGIMALVSPHWKAFTRTEAVYKKLCERCYLNQSRRKALHVSRFGGSYRKMLETRPRVRTGGVYVLKYSKVKKIQRDMWTEIPVGAILESVYYRYMYFKEDGCVLYALTSAPPHEMLPRFVKMTLTGVKDKNALWAQYEVQRHNVTVWASHPWHDVRFELKLLSSDQKVSGVKGVFTAMSFERHMSSVSGNFDEYESTDLVKFDVPTKPFRFLRDW
eukprot:CAMPEP_0181057764 /NCGR_PEP_ID=MMETSP1070-20121207/20427_1 /TAXON_ID=265543 /ORGANISM="Minutocellus polymorphus, Strain NH13" /LENGTH=501 /DNA_ID=CAMNT_0023137205 /DNA_START=9 /DNA_END=1511 /DNA_ORIENTATION=-